ADEALERGDLTADRGLAVTHPDPRSAEGAGARHRFESGEMAQLDTVPGAALLTHERCDAETRPEFGVIASCDFPARAVRAPRRRPRATRARSQQRRPSTGGRARRPCKRPLRSRDRVRTTLP